LLNNEAVIEVGKEMLAALEDPIPPEFVREFQESTIHHPLPEEFLSTVRWASLGGIMAVGKGWKLPRPLRGTGGRRT
jgi:hypothetical protein